MEIPGKLICATEVHTSQICSSERESVQAARISKPWVIQETYNELGLDEMLFVSIQDFPPTGHQAFFASIYTLGFLVDFFWNLLLEKKICF